MRGSRGTDFTLAVLLLHAWNAQDTGHFGTGTFMAQAAQLLDAARGRARGVPSVFS